MIDGASARPRRNERARYVVVSGPPGSGKTTLSTALAAELAWPLVAKDAIKETLLDALDVADVDGSRRVGRSAVAVLLAIARSAPCAVLESAWHRELAIEDLRSLGGEVVEVFCRCPPDLLPVRYAERMGERHPGHFDAVRTPAELWNDRTMHPVAGGWPVIEVDTTSPVDLQAVAVAVQVSFDH